MDKKYYFVLIFLLAAVLVVLVLVSPSLRQVMRDLAEVSAKKDKIADLNNLIAETQELKEYEKRVGRIDLVVPKKEDSPDLTIAFEDLIRKNGLIMESIEFGEAGDNVAATDNNSFNELRANLVVTGSYNDFKRYLGALEKNIRILDVGSISFRNSGPDTSLIDFLLEIKAYYQ